MTFLVLKSPNSTIFSLRHPSNNPLISISSSLSKFSKFTIINSPHPENKFFNEVILSFNSIITLYFPLKPKL